MNIGYARVSTKTQDTETQINCLKDAGCGLIFHETEKGGRWERPELHKMFGQLRKGDVIVVWKLDRLSRSLKDLLTLMDKLDKMGCGFKSLTEAIDTTTPAGRMMMQIIGSFAEFERSILRERTMSGLEAARKKGRCGGRKHSLSKDQTYAALDLIQSGLKTAADVARMFKVSPSTVCRLLQRYQDDPKQLLLRH